MIESDENGEGEDNPFQRSENLHFLDYVVAAVMEEMSCVMV